MFLVIYVNGSKKYKWPGGALGQLFSLEELRFLQGSKRETVLNLHTGGVGIPMLHRFYLCSNSLTGRAVTAGTGEILPFLVNTSL